MQLHVNDMNANECIAYASTLEAIDASSTRLLVESNNTCYESVKQIAVHLTQHLTAHECECT